MTLQARADAFAAAFPKWRTVGRILLQRSTNHRARTVSIFERVAA